MSVIERWDAENPPTWVWVRDGGNTHYRLAAWPGPSPHGTVVEVVPAEQHRGAVEALERIAALWAEDPEDVAAAFAAGRKIAADYRAGGQ